VLNRYDSWTGLRCDESSSGLGEGGRRKEGIDLEWRMVGILDDQEIAVRPLEERDLATR